jgi:dienelactone hydrolase
MKSILKLAVLSLAFISCHLQAKTIELITTDNVKLHGQYFMPVQSTIKHPAVILIHQGGSDMTEWDFMVPSLLNLGYVVLAYDVRSHGKSQKAGKIGPLFNDPQLAPKDVVAAIKFLKSNASIDSKRIAVVGSSIGANLANVAIANMGIKTAVAMSGKTAAVFNLAAKKTLDMQSVFYISSNESDGARAKWAKQLYDMTKSPRKITIVEGSQAHGVGIFNDDAALQQQVLAWLQKTL